jgi:hypothetical protein
VLRLNGIPPDDGELPQGDSQRLELATTTPTGRIPAEPPAKDVEATAKNIEAALLEVAAQFGVDLDAIDKPVTRGTPIR